jgi:nucleoside-diphosphate-sugar epimerase
MDMSDGPVIVTGAQGFIGKALCARFAESQRPHIGLVRGPIEGADSKRSLQPIGDLAIAPEAELESVLEGASAVVHLAGRAHAMQEQADAEARFHAANVVATERLARAALRAGVSRFILASTVKVHGEATEPGKPFRADDPYAPADAYARSKVAAEQALLATCRETWMRPLILRLPLVYGPGVKGNFLTLLDAVARRAWLPLGAIVNHRDLLYVGNLVAVIEALLDERTPAAGAWLVADGESVSTRDLVRNIAGAMRIAPRLVSVPVPLVEMAASLSGREEQLARVAGTLEVDCAPIWALLGSRPYTPSDGLVATVRWWRMRHAI